MGYIAKGLYRELLDEAWIEGSIPNDMTELADICDCPVDVMTEAWPRIVTCWLIDGDRWVNDKLESLRTEVDTIRVTKSRAGRIGGLTKLKNKLEAEQADASKVKQKLADAKHVLEPASGCHIEEEEKRRGREEISEAKASSPRNDSGTPDPIEEIYFAYPKKVGKGAAIKAIKRAVQHVKARGSTLRDAQGFLWKTVSTYARSPAGKGQYVPNPATWFNEGRYDDDQQEWQKSGSERGSNGHRPQSKNRLTEGAVERVTELLGWGETGESEPRHGRALH